MIKRWLIFVEASTLALVTAGANADPVLPPAKMVTQAQVDRLCDSSFDFAVAKPNEGLTFWDVTDGLIPAAGEGLWWRIDDITLSAVVDPLGAHGPNTQVSVWQAPGNVLVATALFTSDSGDWAYFVDYCYRPDGRLARTSSTFNSFVAADVPGGIRRERTKYFDRNGKVTDSRSAVSALSSGERLKIRVTGYDEPGYLTVSTLPFYPLLSAALDQRPTGPNP